MKKFGLTILSTVLIGILLCSCSSDVPSESEVAVVDNSVETYEETADDSVVPMQVSETGAEAAAVTAVAGTTDEVNSNVQSKKDIVEVTPSELNLDKLNSSDDRWYKAESLSLSDGTYGYFRLMETFTPDNEGNVYLLTYTDSDYNNFQLKTYNIWDNVITNVIDIDEKDVCPDENYSTDCISFAVNGQGYVEVDRYNYDFEGQKENVDIKSKVYAINNDTGVLEERIGFLGHNEVVTAAFNTNNGSCIATMEITGSDNFGTNCKLKFFSDSVNPNKVVDFDGLINKSAIYVYSVASMDNGDYIVEYMDEDYDICYVILSQDGTACESAPTLISGALGVVQIFNYANQLFVFEDSGLYLVQGDELVPVYESGYSYDGYISSLYSYPVVVEDDRIIFITSFYSDNVQLSADTLYLTDCPYGDKTRITVGILRYYSDIVLEEINYFNSNNDEYYAVPVLINDEGVNPLISSQKVESRKNLLMEAIPYGNDDYINEVATECAFNMELKEFLGGPDAPDVLATDGMMGQLINSNLMEDLSPIYDELSGDEYFSNIFDASRLSGNRFIPVFYSIGGVFDYNAGDAANTDNYELTYSDYQNFVNKNWGGLDPVTYSCAPYQYVEELMSYQYDLYVNRENGQISLVDNDYFNQMILYILYAVEPSYVTTDAVGNKDVDYNAFFDVNYFLNALINNEVATYSLPSADGRSIGADPTLCFGITKVSANSEGARAFVKSTLSYESQLLSDDRYCGLPINRKALVALAKDYADEDISRVSSLIENVNTVYIVDAELRYACYGPILSLINGDYNNSDYAPGQAGHDIEINMEYFLKED